MENKRGLNPKKKPIPRKEFGSFFSVQFLFLFLLIYIAKKKVSNAKNNDTGTNVSFLFKIAMKPNVIPEIATTNIKNIGIFILVIIIIPLSFYTISITY